MSKGRKPTPTALKKLRGTDQPCRTNDKEIQLSSVSKLPYAPKWFSETQKNIYHSKGKQLIQLGLLTQLDFEIFISFCAEYGNYIDTSIQMRKIPLTAKLNEASNDVFKRIEKINKQSWERSKAIASEFGFTPSSRAKMVMPQQPDPDDIMFD